ncbi:MAG: hypothetical protein AB7U29_00230 [Desulfobulbus sp.]
MYRDPVEELDPRQQRFPSSVAVEASFMKRFVHARNPPLSDQLPLQQDKRILDALTR